MSACELVFVWGELVGASWSWGEMTGYQQPIPYIAILRRYEYSTF